MSSANPVSIAEKIRKAIEKESSAKAGINVTVSIGCAIKIKGDTPESLIAKADKAMYHAKKNGKNMVVSYDNIK